MADVSVRPAGPDDAGEIARIQLATWQIAYSDVLPAPALDQLDEAEVVRTWQAAITAPPSPRHRVFVAVEGAATVGFAASAPDETGVEFGPLLVEPRWGRRGHGSRLLAACVAHARGDGAPAAGMWIPEADVASRQFLTSAGWAPDGTLRGLDTGHGELREIHLHTELDAPEPVSLG